MRIRDTTEYFIQFRQTLGGPFSAVWTATIATKYSFCWIFEFFEIYKICNPLHRSDRKISEKRVTILAILNKYSELFIQKFTFFKSKERFFVKMVGILSKRTLSEFHEHAPKCQRIFNFLKKQIQFCEKSVKNP